ncbi:YqgE/AlgH family protein [Candidatus Rariloculus sp.]|uniref:YqgE/AlgH family protein n=1 Tax=Candidatus Rariloculus sp. TaxID=3101265 RepID=UPI003D09EE59
MTAITKLGICAAALLLGLAAHAQIPSTGALLVATGALSDPNFSESVVLLIRHNSNGTIGVVINRPTWVEPAQLLPELQDTHGDAGRVFFGGPVAPTRTVLLVREPPPDDVDNVPVLDGVYVSSSAEFLFDSDVDIANESRLRIYAGHAAWAPGQLAAEIAEGSWSVVTGSSDLVFSRDPLRLWRDMESSNSGLIAGLAHGPR